MATRHAFGKVFGMSQCEVAPWAAGFSGVGASRHRELETVVAVGLERGRHGVLETAVNRVNHQAQMHRFIYYTHNSYSALV